MAVTLTWSQSILAGADFSPLDRWQFRYIPAGGALSLLHRATAVAVVVTITTGSETVQQRSPVVAGGTTGVMPSSFDVASVDWTGAKGDLQTIEYSNSSLGAIVVDGTIAYEY